MFRFLLLMVCLLGSSCSNKDAFDPRTVETDAGAAVFRRLIADCPYFTPERPLCLTIGPAQSPLTPAFKARFTEYQDRLLDHRQVTATVIDGKVRVQQKPTGLTAGPLVLLLQISALTSAGGNYEAIAAWAFKDDMVRRKYIAIPQPDGSFQITAGEILETKGTPPKPAAEPNQ